MSNKKEEALYRGKRHYDKDGKPLGGIKVVVDDSFMVEVEGGEYKICTDAYNSNEVLSFENKTNKEILDYIHNNFSCKFEQSKAESGDFILCRLVVNDTKKKNYSGTVRQVLDAMQLEHSCRVSFGDKSMKKGGEISPEEIEERWNKKKEHIEKLSEAIRSLRNNLTRDIKGDDEKEKLTALAISVIDKTAERVGNGDSEQNGHFGVTGFQKNHIKIDGNTVYLNYIGKSGVKHEKQFSDELIAGALKNAIKYSSCAYVFCTSDGFRIKPDKINRYLSEYGITAKDIRGYSANRWIVDKLNNIEEKDIPETEAKRKRKFNKILKSVAAKVGHGSGTLKKHYMIPELETTFIQGGEILNLSSFYSKGGSVSDEKNLLFKDYKYLNALLEYVYYNNPNEDDELQPTDAPKWIIDGSKKYLNKKGISKIYRGVGLSSYDNGIAYSWTYDKKVAENFGGNVLEMNLPENLVSVEYVFDLIKKHKYYPEGATQDFVDWINDFEGGESEVIVIGEKLSKGGYVRLAKTPAPKSDRVYGSKKNAPQSAASKESGKNIELSSSIVSSILNKLKEHNSNHKDKRVTIGVAKAVVRRGMGAYSATHRPTIKGGQPNSRVAWGLARLNAFLIKAATGKSKSGRYSQDNDLLDELNIPHKKYENGGNFKRQVVGNIIYSKNQGFLFLQRADDCEKNSGKWHILSGGVEEGESLEVAAKREFVEEVGYNGEIEIEKLQTIDFKDYEFTYFLIMPKKPFNPKLDFENKDYKWVYSIDEMLNTDLIPELKEYLISFNQGIKKYQDEKNKQGGDADIRYSVGGKMDRSGNLIGDGEWQVNYHVFDFEDYPQVHSSVSKSQNTESVYVTYLNRDNGNSITVRFSNHENNAVKFGDQLNGFIATKIEVLFHLGLAKRKFIPKTFLWIDKQAVAKKNLSNYEIADKTIQEMYAMGEGADISMYKGKLAKDSNYLILGSKVERLEDKTRNALGEEVTRGEYVYEKLEDGGGVDKNCIDFIKKTDAILKNGYYHRFDSLCLITYNSGNQKDLNVYQTVNLLLSKSLSELLKIDEESARNLISEYCDNASRFDTLDIIKELKGCNIVIADIDKIVCANNMQNDKGGEIENLISQGIINLKFYETTPEHAKEYGIKAIKPIFVQNLCVSEKHRLKGIGNKFLEYIESYAQNNGNDVIFGYVADNAVFSKDSMQSYFCDADMVKNWLQSKGYAINDDNNDFHKAIKDGTNTTFDANLIAPNGKPSNLTPEQYKLVRTPEFKAWFGDWERLAMATIKDPAIDEVTLGYLSKDVSKVVDDNGEPLVVYHGTYQKFNVFEISKEGGFFFTEFKRIATIYAESVRMGKGGYKNDNPILIEAFLNIRKIQEINFHQKVVQRLTQKVKSAKNKGFNGMLIKNGLDVGGYYDQYVVFSSVQIKLADGTNTTFDGNNSDIRYEKGGNVEKEKKEIYQKWKRLVNMTAAELEKFYNSEEGKDAGLKPKEAKDLGIHYGRESARWIIKMKKTPITEWTLEMWEWAKRQINFNTRMLGNRGGLYDEKGKKTRKHTSLLIWGHNPEKKENGGGIYSVEEMIIGLSKSPFLKVFQMPDGLISFSESNGLNSFKTKKISAAKLQELFLIYNF